MPVEIYPTCLFKPMNIAAFMRWVSSDWPNSCACSSHYRLVSAHVQSVLELVAQATSLKMKRRGCKDMSCCSSLQDNSKNFKLAENRRGIFFFWLMTYFAYMKARGQQKQQSSPSGAGRDSVPMSWTDSMSWPCQQGHCMNYRGMNSGIPLHSAAEIHVRKLEFQCI